MFAESVAHASEEVDLSDPAAFHYYWGSLVSSMYTLFKSFTSGVDWEHAVKPLSEVNPGMVPVFTLFVCFAHFAVLNVVTGVFVQSAIDNAALDQDMAVHKVLNGKKRYMAKIVR